MSASEPGEKRRDPPSRTAERLCERSVRVRQHSLAVAAEDDLRCGVRQRAARRDGPQQRVDAEALARRDEVADRPQCVGDGENAVLGPPERDLPPPPHVTDHEDLEGRRRDRLGRDDMERNAKPFRERSRVAVVAVEQLDHACRPPGGAYALLDTVAVHRIDEPDALVHDKRMRAASQQLVVDDPPEPAVELVAAADRYAVCHSAADRSASGMPLSRIARTTACASKGTRRNSIRKGEPETTAYSAHGSHGFSAIGSVWSYTRPVLPAHAQNARPMRRSHCRCTWPATTAAASPTSEATRSRGASGRTTSMLDVGVAWQQTSRSPSTSTSTTGSNRRRKASRSSPSCACDHSPRRSSRSRASPSTSSPVDSAS